jgi:hypothetical protein
VSAPNLEQLRKTARDLLTAFHAGDPLARKRVAAHIPRLARSGTELRLSETQLVVARENGYPSWPKLKAAIESGAAGELAGPGGRASVWQKRIVEDAARQATECAERRDVEGLLCAMALLGRRAGDAVRGLLVERGAYPAVVDTLMPDSSTPIPGCASSARSSWTTSPTIAASSRSSACSMIRCPACGEWLCML